jgi:heme/copper-type cytochrome/quinol oxidase subunit 3
VLVTYLAIFDTLEDIREKGDSQEAADAGLITYLSSERFLFTALLFQKFFSFDPTNLGPTVPKPRFVSSFVHGQVLPSTDLSYEK